MIKQNNNFQIAYTNLTKQDEYNMPLSQEKSWLPLFTFQANTISDGSVFSNDNKFITFNQDILSELTDI